MIRCVWLPLLAVRVVEVVPRTPGGEIGGGSNRGGLSVRVEKFSKKTKIREISLDERNISCYSEDTNKTKRGNNNECTNDYGNNYERTG